jgi:polysaccharide pyruvyl transferase WcaK-like protein
MIQSYALTHFLEKNGYIVEILDFVPRGLRMKAALFPINDRRSLTNKAVRFLPALICNIVEYCTMNIFVNKHLNVTKKRYHSYNDVISDLPKADTYICGSDQIWNTQNYNLSDDIRVYYLDLPTDKAKKISYAASFGKDAFSNGEMGNIKNWLSSFSGISVREDNALCNLHRMGIDRAVQVLDPSFLLKDSDWETLIVDKKPVDGYVFVYNLNRNAQLKKISLQIAAERKLRIVNFADTFEFIKGAENRLINGPLDFLRYIANAEYIITDSFHGIALSINFNRQFICVPAPKYNCRLESLLRLFGLENRLIIGEIPNHLIDSIGKVEYKDVNKILIKEREASGEYLLNLLGKEI